jgi:hypothetical protein
LVINRAREWGSGERERLVLTARNFRRRLQKPLPDEGAKVSDIEKAAIAALRLGDVKKALQVLNSTPFAENNSETVKALQSLHPEATKIIPPMGEGDFAPVPFARDLVLTALSSFGAGSGAGLFGYRPLLLQQCVRFENYVFPRALCSVVNCLAAGRAPPELRHFLAGGVSIALEKKPSGVRPLCCGDPIRRLVSKCFCIGGKERIAEVFRGNNYGVGCPGGVEVVAHSLRSTLRTAKGRGMGLLKIDFKNAFNTIDRGTFLEAVKAKFPRLAKWAYWCYEGPSTLLFDKHHVIRSSSGVQQGDPLGPLLFCCALAPLIAEIDTLGPLYNKWYMDDGGIVGPPDLLQRVWDILRTKGPSIGLILNPAKCE